jgi:hypothetical protein
MVLGDIRACCTLLWIRRERDTLCHPMVAGGGAVMGTEYSNAKLVCWSILLIHGNFAH